MIPRLRLTAALTLGAFTLLSCNDATAPTQPGPVADQPPTPEFAWASNSWQTRAPLPTGREGLAAGVVTSPTGQQILYLLGGIEPNSSQDVTTIDAYDYASNSWTARVAWFAGWKTNGVGQIGSKLYVSGGWGAFTGEGRTIRPSLFVYDPATDVVTRLANMPRPTASGVTGVIGGKLYVLTGFCANCPESISRRFYRYDPATNTWGFLNWVPRAHADGAGGVINGKFYVAGGYDGTSVSAGLDVYDPVTQKWSARAALPAPVAEVAGAVLNNKLYVVGGNTTYMYDPVTNRWATKAPLPTPRNRLATAAVTAFGNTKLLALGGSHDEATAKKNEAYKP
jgi:N-acetylneuraminic acid mutarotase